MTRAVLTFHAVDNDGGVLSFPPATFERLIDALQEAGVPVLAYDDLLRGDHGVTLTFDDGMQSVHRHALPLLSARKLPAHLFLTTGAVGRDNRWPSQPAQARTRRMLDWAQVRDCAAHGVQIECHTHGHPDLRTLDARAIDDECERADREIEREVGRRPMLFAYPYGHFDRRIAAAVGARYRACFTTRMGYLGVRVDAAAVPRIDVHYLRAPWIQRRLMAGGGRAYLGLRAWIRVLRGIR